MEKEMNPAPVLGGTIPMIPAGDDIEQTITFTPIGMVYHA